MAQDKGRVLIGAIEGGGTKFVCAIGESGLGMRERTVVPTTDPLTTIGECVRYFRAAAGRLGPIASLGIGCFGPLQLRTEAPHYGRLLSTPKSGWAGMDICSPFREAFGIPVVLDTDVGAAASGELGHGAGRGRASLGYVTVGTGIGGAVVPGRQDTRAMHAEMGHLAVRRDPRDLQFAGVCPFHGDCLEGLASGPAIRARWGCDLAALPGDHPARQIIAGYLAQMAASIALLHAPEVLVMGGGVLSDGTLLPLIRTATLGALGGYLPHLREREAMDAFIRAPALGTDSAIVGAATMALEALHQSQEDHP